MPSASFMMREISTPVLRRVEVARPAGASTCACTRLRMSVIARCAATPSTCESAKPVAACTSVAAPAASASGQQQIAARLPITSSIRTFEVAGRTRPGEPADEHQSQAERQASAVRPDQLARLAPDVCPRRLLLRRRVAVSGARAGTPGAALGPQAAVPQSSSRSPHCSILTLMTSIRSTGASPLTGTASSACTTSMPSTTWPNAVYLRSSDGAGPVQMKNDVEALAGSSSAPSRRRRRRAACR